MWMDWLSTNDIPIVCDQKRTIFSWVWGNEVPLESTIRKRGTYMSRVFYSFDLYCSCRWIRKEHGGNQGIYGCVFWRNYGTSTQEGKKI